MANESKLSGCPEIQPADVQPAYSPFTRDMAVWAEQHNVTDEAMNALVGIIQRHTGRGAA